MNETPRQTDSVTPPPTYPAPLELDLEKYKADYKDSGMSDAQIEDYLRALWNIMMHFVRMGFNLDPSQQSCGKLLKNAGPSTPDSLDAVESDNPMKQSFTAASKEE